MLPHLFPAKLYKTIRAVFGVEVNPPVLLKLIPAVDLPRLPVDQTEPYTFLCRNEHNQLQKYSLAKRRSEYLTSRICAKIATDNYLQSRCRCSITMQQIEIANSEYGRPFISIHPEPPCPIPELSLSHSAEYGVAFTARYRCGIDIQVQRQSLAKVKEKFCTEREYSILTKNVFTEKKVAKLALLWSAKEAIQKNLSTSSMPFFSEIQLLGCECRDGGSAVLSFSLLTRRDQNWPKQITVVAGIFKDYAIAVSTRKEKSDA